MNNMNFKEWLLSEMGGPSGSGFSMSFGGVGDIGTDAIVKNCKGKKDSYNVWGSCSNTKKKKKSGKKKK